MGVDDVVGKRFGRLDDFWQASPQQVSAERGEERVGGLGPDLDGGHHVAVVDGGEGLQQVGFGLEIGRRGLALQQCQQGLIALEGCAVGQQLAGASEDAVEEVVGGDDGFVEVDLPVHQPSRDDEFLDGVDALFVDDELVVVHVEHRDDAVGADDAFADSGEERVAPEVVEPVHIELGGDELVEEASRVGVVEYADSQLQTAIRFTVNLLHKKQRQMFVMHVAEGAFGGVGEGSVSDVVEENGEFGGLAFVVAYLHPFLSQHFEGSSHQVECAEHMAEAGVHSAWVDEIGESELLDGSLSLEERMVDDGEDEGVVDAEESVVDWVVDDFAFHGVI